MKKKMPSSFPESNEKIVSAAWIARRSAVSFSIFIVLVCTAVLGWRWFRHLPGEQGNAAVKAPIRAVLNTNEALFSRVLSDRHETRSYSKPDAAAKVRVNGGIGLTGVTETAIWRLKVVRGDGDTLSLPLAALQQLQKTEIVFNFKCIEGWSQVSWWGGVRLSDFIKAYHLDAERNMKYIGLETPDKAYYVGIDMKSALHPQTILCYEMNGQPLPANQGYPLRLIIPVKYGVKSLKQIGTISFSDQRPRDYWAERGYDYFSGL